MQEAIPFRTYIPATATGGSNRRLHAAAAPDPRDGGGNNSGGGGGGGGVVPLTLSDGENHVQKLVLENSIIVFGKHGCCMCHVVKRLLLGLGVNPTVFEVDEMEEAAVIKELSTINSNEKKDGGGSDGGGQVQFPVVFVGGKLFGGLERVMATHISGELVPILKDAGALWL